MWTQTEPLPTLTVPSTFPSHAPPTTRLGTPGATKPTEPSSAPDSGKEQVWMLAIYLTVSLGVLVGSLAMAVGMARSSMEELMRYGGLDLLHGFAGM